ncbi:MAG TPA: AAA family ATPase, partial [Verrucomicrobiae bacterium]|nr:AAA family ATPase [Verrucomicrobiae bacterium]
LTDRVRQTPCSLLLLDEIEKADPQMMHLFLQVFDAGRLTDARGRTVSFSDVTIVMTSNTGTDLFGREEMGYSKNDGARPVTKKALMRELKRFFPPEFLNRIDEIVYFDSLGAEQMARIARLQLRDLAAGLEREGRRLVVTDAAAAVLAREGFHPEFGARHLTRALRRLILEPLAGLSLTDDFRTATRIVVDADGARIRLELGFDAAPAGEAVVEETGLDAREDGAET